MSQFLTLLCACSPLMKATASVLEGAAIVLAVWTVAGVFGALLFGQFIRSNRRGRA